MTVARERGAPRSLFADPTPLLTREQCEAIAKKVLSFATADETRVTIASQTDGNMRFAVNQASTSGDNYDHVVNVRSVFGKRAVDGIPGMFSADPAALVSCAAER